MYGSGMSVLRAPPKPEILIAATMYGATHSSRSGSPATSPKTRSWIVVEDAPVHEPVDEPGGRPLPLLVGRLVLRMFVPGSRHLVATHDMGLIDEVEIRQGRNARWNVMLASGEQITAVAAPCVCGAGRVGNAGPTDERHSIQRVRPDSLPWMTMV